ncbi:MULTISPECIES: hypothetical protein [Rhodococcus]|nr:MULTISPECIES: hypothetical protein [Rhodococcus]
MTQPPFTPQDKTAMVLLAKMEERRPEETVDVTFTPEADRQPLDETDQTTPAPNRPSRPGPPEQ